jgi:hypothetical protein
MSHFTVLVIGDDVEKQLQGYHEFECTGIDDEYVVDVDKTAEFEEEFINGTQKMLLIEGRIEEPYQEKYKFLTPGQEDRPAILRTHEYKYPPGAELTDIPHHAVYDSFREFVVKWHGYDEDGKYARFVDDESAKHGVRIIDRTNPNAKWDWWTVGGRWTGHFRLRDDIDMAAIKKFRKADHVPRCGDPGLMTKPASAGRADSCLKQDIDIDGMRNEAAAIANAKYDRFEAATAGLEPAPRWKEVREAHEDIDAARDAYGKYPWVMALRENALDPFGDDAVDYYFIGQGGRERFVKRARDTALSTFAVVKDGKWYESGNMGWWGIVSDAKELHVWLDEFNKLIDDLPGDTLLTVVDCHI